MGDLYSVEYSQDMLRRDLTGSVRIYMVAFRIKQEYVRSCSFQQTRSRLKRSKVHEPRPAYADWDVTGDLVTLCSQDCDRLELEISY